MTKIDIISGFLGAGKTTLIKKLVKEAFQNEKIVLIENEFGEISVDQSFLKEAGIQITEMNSGCICCSLVGDFEVALQKVLEQYSPDRIIIEPSGVGKLSDVIQAVKKITTSDVVLHGFITVIDAKKCRLYTKNFGEFFNNQIENASMIILSRSQDIAESKLNECMNIIRKYNTVATVMTTPWDQVNGKKILEVMDSESLELQMIKTMNSHEHHHECSCENHHHDHECGEHHNHHDHECQCHHHADEVFTSWAVETFKNFSKTELNDILHTLTHSNEYGNILRAKGIVKGETWLEFDVVPEEVIIREGSIDVTGKICVIGEHLDKDKLKQLFNL